VKASFFPVSFLLNNVRIFGHSRRGPCDWASAGESKTGPSKIPLVRLWRGA
jgi:hypothetical protein